MAAEDHDGHWLFDGSSRSSLVMICAFLLVLGIGTYWLWGNFGHYILSQPSYQLSTEAIEVSPQPPWIQQTDVKAEALQSSTVAGLSIRQEDVTLRVAQAFTLHPWVAKVHRVVKRYPARVIVDVEYRRPVAMVEVSHNGAPGLLPIDGQGVLLPTVDLRGATAGAYMRIRAVNASPTSRLGGTPWGDDRIHGAAKVAEMLLSHRTKFELDLIEAYRGPRVGLQQPPAFFVLRTVKGTAVVWGSAPGEEVNGEPLSETKFARLTEFVNREGTLDNIPAGHTIDLRRTGSKVALLPEELR